MSIAPRFDSAYDFGEGLAYAEAGDSGASSTGAASSHQAGGGGQGESVAGHRRVQGGLAAVTTPRGEGSSKHARAA